MLALLALEARDSAAANLFVGHVILLLAAIAEKIHPRLVASLGDPSVYPEDSKSFTKRFTAHLDGNVRAET